MWILPLYVIQCQEEIKRTDLRSKWNNYLNLGKSINLSEHRCKVSHFVNGEDNPSYSYWCENEIKWSPWNTWDMGLLISLMKCHLLMVFRCVGWPWFLCLLARSRELWNFCVIKFVMDSSNKARSYFSIFLVGHIF